MSSSTTLAKSFVGIINYSIAAILALSVSAHAQPSTTGALQDDISFAQPYVKANQKNTTFLKIALTGNALVNNTRQVRPSVNVALVIDRSGSMSGQKLQRAKESALLAVDLLSSNDILSIVTYEDDVNVVVPATKLTDKNMVRQRIQNIQAAGSTALYAGVDKGASEISKFLNKNRVNRVVLISDGIANVGPSSPSELAALGQRLSHQGMSVSTVGLGLGYNEELMVRFAQSSDGNHAFAENSTDLAQIFQAEFEDVLTVVAQDITIQIDFFDGVTPLRVLGRDAVIKDQRLTTKLSQVYGEQEKYILVEVALPAHDVAIQQPVAEVQINYRAITTQENVSLQRKVAINYTETDAEIAQNSNKAVQASVVEQVGNLLTKEAVSLRDAGQNQAAKTKLNEAANLYRNASAELAAPELNDLADNVANEAESMDDEAEWNRSRKALRAQQYQTENQYKKRK